MFYIYPKYWYQVLKIQSFKKYFKYQVLEIQVLIILFDTSSIQVLQNNKNETLSLMFISHSKFYYLFYLFFILFFYFYIRRGIY